MQEKIIPPTPATQPGAVYHIKQRYGCLVAGFIILALALAVMAYLLGKKNSSKTIDNIAMNNVLIQQIAELSSLEVQGTASIKSSNVLNDGSITDVLKKMFLEKTANITVPYVAKYGIDLGKQTLNIEEKNKEVYIVLPTPRLLSYELRLDKTDAMLRRGLFESDNDNYYNSVEKKLYTQSRIQLEQNQAYIQQSKEKIRQIIESYYQPMSFRADIVFADEIKSKVVSPEPQ